MAQRFVILEHSVNGGVHFDLMLEVAGQELLRTFQLARWPLAVGEACACVQLADHRRVYLEYEGEISGGRGTVRRVAAGSWSGGYELACEGGEVVRLQIAGVKVERYA
ncbi:MAG: hypothetical protein ICCCNLDF_01705 [Planctomycetes bacterium]|nr:hypothetical protein [Planctomycetota bacterium]